MSVQQDRCTFFGVLVAVVIVVLGYLQLSQLYPVAGNKNRSMQVAPNQSAETYPVEASREEEIQP